MNDQTVANAVRIEYDNDNDTLYIVFEVTDEELKHTIRNEWEKDMPLQLIGKKLIRK